MVRMVTVTAAPNAEAEVVDLVSALIRFDTSNTGEPDTTKGEAECARWVAKQLEEVGYETEYVEAGAPGRGNLFTRLKGANPDRGALLLHGHLDVVPAEASDWSVHPFSGAVEDGYVWGRGAVDMKDMCGMLIAIARHFKRTGIVPPRDLVFAFVSDEEAGGKFGCKWLVENRPDLFEGVTEAIGEVGGFSLTVPVGHLDFAAQATIGALSAARTVSGWGFGDIMGRFQLGWTHGPFSHTFYLSGWLPTGRIFLCSTTMGSIISPKCVSPICGTPPSG